MLPFANHESRSSQKKKERSRQTRSPSLWYVCDSLDRIGHSKRLSIQRVESKCRACKVSRAAWSRCVTWVLVESYCDFVSAAVGERRIKGLAMFVINSSAVVHVEYDNFDWL